MTSKTERDGHVHLLPLTTANKIAAGEVVERPASVVKELAENSIDAGSKHIKITIAAGGRKLIAVRDDGCGMTRDDAVMSLERQATSKILDVNDIENITTLGFRGEAIPSIASVSRFSITTRTADSDEGTCLVVNAGALSEVRAAGCPPGTLVEVRDLFCNVPARRKFLRAYATEEAYIKSIFTSLALSHPDIGFSLTIDGREIYALAPSRDTSDRIADLFGGSFTDEMVKFNAGDGSSVEVHGYIERPGMMTGARRDQYIFINRRAASAPSIAYAIREAYPRRSGDVRPALVMFVKVDAHLVDVNVHPTKREVRFRNNAIIRDTVTAALERAFSGGSTERNEPAENATIPVVETQPYVSAQNTVDARAETACGVPTRTEADCAVSARTEAPQKAIDTPQLPGAANKSPYLSSPPKVPYSTGTILNCVAQPLQVQFACDPDSTSAKPWKWFRFLSMTASGYLLIETDAGIVFINPAAARERLVFEELMNNSANENHHRFTQPLLMPVTVELPPADAARIKSFLPAISSLGFRLEEFGRDTFKIDAVPQIMSDAPLSSVLATVAADLAEGGTRRATTHWREDIAARAVAKACFGMTVALDEKGAVKLVYELAAAKMPYISPRGKPVMVFYSTRELNRKFKKE